MKEAIGMRNYLEKGKIGDGDGAILQGRQLARTPVKRTTGEADKEESDGDGGGVDEINSKGKQEMAQGKLGGEQAAEGASGGKVGEEFVAMYERIMGWMDVMDGRMAELVSKIDREQGYRCVLEIKLRSLGRLMKGMRERIE